MIFNLRMPIMLIFRLEFNLVGYIFLDPLQNLTIGIHNKCLASTTGHSMYILKFNIDSYGFDIILQETVQYQKY